MSRIRYRHLALLWSSGHGPKQRRYDRSLGNRDLHRSAPAGAASTLIPFHVEVNGRDADGFDVTVSNAAAVVSVILPNGTEVNSSNAASFGFQFEVLAADSDGVTDGLMTSIFSLAGTHTSIRLPETAVAGIYQVKINNSSVPTNTSGICVVYNGFINQGCVSFRQRFVHRRNNSRFFRLRL